MNIVEPSEYLKWTLVAILLSISSVFCSFTAYSEELGDQPTGTTAEAAADTGGMQSVKNESVEDMFVEGWREGVIETRYLMTDSLSASTIDVVVKGSKAILSGTVSSNVEKQLAKEVALSVSGIEEVDNQLTVAPKETESPETVAPDTSSSVRDALITTTIKARYLASPHLNPLDISVSTHKGVVELKGEVATEAQKDLAFYIAQNIKSVKEVHNLVELDSSSS
ncbi:hypothetical protein BTA51_12025 [Hahella sp. CCB-MM4]|uniref:BON domain-containing protein n=1 Tax=Hahella sp. (strain CCB-MM4) TaxID=1926491 RepID=UPI000BCD9906|nr:BON domain-containing protein [Hahella sp. CCB-MM4]OZG73203.1 hypothetical protein BTA51_12025 [Hahella sp. CCB-MM4]